MTNATLRTEHIQDSQNIYEDIKADDLPAVSIVKPGWPSDGPPSVFEARTVRRVREKHRERGAGSTRSVGQHGNLYHGG